MLFGVPPKDYNEGQPSRGQPDALDSAAHLLTLPCFAGTSFNEFPWLERDYHKCACKGKAWTAYATPKVSRRVRDSVEAAWCCSLAAG